MKHDGWDYYDRQKKEYIYLDCRLHQKYYTQSPLEAELEENFRSGLSIRQRETPDAQLHDSDGIWFTRSDDPDNYADRSVLSALDEEISRESISEYSETQKCALCTFICDIRDDERYLLEEGSCPFPSDPGIQLEYWKVQDYDRPCQDFLHPLLLQDIEALNRKKRRMAKAKLWGYLKQKKWRDTLINKEERIVNVWRRNYQPVQVFYNSFETIWLYLKNLPIEMKQNPFLLQRIRKNLEYSPSYQQNLAKGEYEKRMLENIDKFVDVEGKGKK